jgi:hypothetical protein
MKIEHTIGLLIDNIDNPGWKLMYNYNNRDWDALKDSRQCDFYQRFTHQIRHYSLNMADCDWSLLALNISNLYRC